MRRSRAAIALSFAAVASLTLGACANGNSAGGGEGGGGGGGPKDLVIGMLVPLTGPLGSWGTDWQRAYQQAADEVNAENALPNGGKIKFVVEDEAGSPEAAIRTATKMIQVNHASVIIGPTSDTIVALRQLATTNKVPVISPAAGTTRLDEIGGKWLWRTYPSDSAEGVAMAKYFAGDGVKTAALLTEKRESSEGVAKVFRATFEEQGGKVLRQVNVNPGQASYAAEVNQAVAGNPDLIYMTAGEEAARTILRQIHQSGYKGRIGINGDLTSPEFMKSVGMQIMEGICGGEATPDTSLPAYQRFAAEFKQRNNKDSYVTVSNAYDTPILVALAAIAGKSNAGADIEAHLKDVTNPPGEQVTSFADGVKALKAGKQIDYNGASGVLDFDAHGTSPVPFTAACVKGGKLTPIKTFPAK